jgi:hypothetical protein
LRACEGLVSAVSDPVITATEAELRVLTDAELDSLRVLADDVRSGLVSELAVALFIHRVESGDAVGEA